MFKQDALRIHKGLLEDPHTFCKGLADNEWLVPVSNFAPNDHSSVNVTALRPTAIRKTLVANVHMLQWMLLACPNFRSLSRASVKTQ